VVIEFFARYAQFLTFAVIGVVNTLVHGSILVLEVEYLGVTVVLAHLVAFCVTNLFSYVMNSKLTFRTTLSFARYIRFFAASMLALGLTLLLSWVMDHFGFHYLFGFLMVIVLVPIFTFIVMKSWAFTGAKTF
jgi:putative flippase GtrA